MEGAHEEDGYDLWLRYRPLEGAPRAQLLANAKAIVLPAKPSLTVLAAAAELERALGAMLGRVPPLARTASAGSLVLATPKSLPRNANLDLPFDRLGDEGYAVRAVRLQGRKVTLIAANTDAGLLYGTFAWLRAVCMRRDLGALDEVSAPKVGLRILNHWDNLDRTVERGYAGESIWDWWTLPAVKEQRYVDYARATASLGINGVSLNNVNASAVMLTPQWIAKAKALADIFRPYRIKVYLAVRFSAPVELGELQTADPLDPGVRAWWKKKAAEIHAAIPDFGGFVVKANSEGQPGPYDYGRNHADGANMLGEALAPHGGIVFWRAFVYSQHDPEDRAKQAYRDFKALDGKFAPNVRVQVKNGPIDFQPREPFHPMFGGIVRTPLAMEFQVTKEYLGFATHQIYLGPMYEEVLKTDTRVHGTGPLVADTFAAIAAVGNVGSHRTWSGSHFDQSNWYAYGRFAWDPHARARDIATEWAAQTFTTNPRALRAIVDFMMRSHEALVGYMTPLGLHHIMDTGHHHGPGPWVGDLKRPEWNPTYYHQADRDGVGFDRTAKGSDALSQYAPAIAKEFSDPRTIPEKFLLWFHHLRWDHRMPSGRTLWEEMVARYDEGVAAAKEQRRRWKKLERDVDPRRHREVATLLAVQEEEAQWWRDACIAYFRSVSGLPMPKGTRAPPLTLEQYKSRRFPFAPGRG